VRASIHKWCENPVHSGSAVPLYSPWKAHETTVFSTAIPLSRTERERKKAMPALSRN
jgi:hypothetical protein